MPTTESFPFTRLLVDHLLYGLTQVWWELHPNFLDPFPHLYQLQFSPAGVPNDSAWENVGNPVENAAALPDPERRSFGVLSTSFYRVLVTTPLRTYVSLPVAALGKLSAKDWQLAREIVRKEQLRHRLVSRPGVLLKRRRSGPPCPRCRDAMTDAVTTSRCPLCLGTGFLPGYHAPIPAYFCDIAEEQQTERRGGAAENPGEWSMQRAVAKARLIGCPVANIEDVIVETATDRRWRIVERQPAATIRGVPIVVAAVLAAIPFSDPVYQVEVGGEAPEYLTPPLPVRGCGSVEVTHDYGGADRLAYITPEGRGIPGATISVYAAARYDQGFRGPEEIIAQTTTDGNGRWEYALRLDPGQYVLIYSRKGAYGPDRVDLTVTAPATPLPPPQPPDRYAPGDFGAF